MISIAVHAILHLSTKKQTTLIVDNLVPALSVWRFLWTAF